MGFLRYQGIQACFPVNELFGIVNLVIGSSTSLILMESEAEKDVSIFSYWFYAENRSSSTALKEVVM